MDELIVALSGAIGQVVGTFCIFPLDVLKTMWSHRDEKYDDGLVIFLSSSKHKIKKKAEQAACKESIVKLS